MATTAKKAKAAGASRGGAPLEELYPGYYEFQNRFVSWSGTWARIAAMNSGVTTTTPSTANPFGGAPSQP